MKMSTLIYRVLQNTCLIVVSLGLLYGGITILTAGIPFWSQLYGLSAIGLGIIMSLVSFTEITRSHTATAAEYHQIPCRICRKNTLVPYLVDSTICSACQYRMALKLNMSVLVFFLMLAIPVTYHLTQENQDIRQNAKIITPKITCETGDWEPESCRCGSWEVENHCFGGKQTRICGSETYCCRYDQSGWSCVKSEAR